MQQIVSLANNGQSFFGCLLQCCLLPVDISSLQVSVLRVHLNDQFKQPCLSTEAWISSLQKHPVLYLLTISSISTKHRAAHPHGVHQRPHKQAGNKTGFVSRGKGAGQSKKELHYQRLPLSDQPPKSKRFQF